MTIVRGTQFLCFLLCVSSVVLKELEDEMRDECDPLPKGFYLEDCKTYDCSKNGSHICCGDSCHGVDNGCCTWDTLCKENDGDCDKDIDCEGDLVCGSNNCPWGGWDDCCEKPGPNAPKKEPTLQCDNSIVPKNPNCAADQEKYCKIAKNSNVPGTENTLCKYCGVNEEKCGKKLCLMGITDPAEKQEIVDRHNELRRKVAKGLEAQGRAGKEGQPPAANMMEVEWDDELAKMAQTWVNQCSGAHDKNRNMESGYCGQNYAWKGTWGPYGPIAKKPLTTLIDMWYAEVKDFDKDVIGTFGQGDHTGVVLHYTQYTWAKVTKIGCGYQYGYDGKYFRAKLTCNYCPGGNWYGDNMYKVGPAGSECPEGSTNNDGLCKLN